jgi:hypothetical protein
MAILSFPKNPVCQSTFLSPREHPANLRTAPGLRACTKSRQALLASLALLQAGLVLQTPPALGQNAGAAAPAATAVAPAQTPISTGTPTASALWSRPVPPAAWTVAFKYGTVVTPQQAAHRPTMVKVTLVGKDALETVHFPERTSEVWRVEGAAFISEAGSEHVGIRQDQGLGTLGGVGANSDQVRDVVRGKKGDFTATVNGVVITGNVAQEEPDWAEFKEFDWVTAEMLKGKIEISGEKLLVYADMEPESPAATTTGKGRAAAPAAPKFPAGPLGGLPLKPGIRVAAIEETTKTPRYLQLGENIQIYTFSKPQQTKLELPPKIANMVAKPAPPPPDAKPISLIP